MADFYETFEDGYHAGKGPCVQCRDCGGRCGSFAVTDASSVPEGGIIGGLICLTCGALRLSCLQPGERHFAHARQLAEERGWKDVRP